jgi:hypothetical protein
MAWFIAEDEFILRLLRSIRTLTFSLKREALDERVGQCAYPLIQRPIEFLEKPPSEAVIKKQ